MRKYTTDPQSYDLAREGLNPQAVVNLIALLLFAVLIRVPFFDVPMITDEGGYAYVAQFWTDHYQLYRDIPFDRPQGIFLLYKAIFSSFGSEVTELRLAAAIYNAGTLLVLFLLANQLFTRRIAWWTVLLFSVASASPSIEGFTANAELFASLPLALAALFTWRQQWGWAGFFSGVAFLIKPIGLSGVGLALAWLVVVLMADGNWRGIWRGSLRAGGAFALSLLAMMAHGYFIGWNYFWTSIVERKFATDTVVSRGIVDQLLQLVESLVITAPAWAMLVACASIAYTTWSVPVRRFFWLWIASSVLGMAIGGHWSRHYYVQLIPALALMGGTGIDLLLRGSTHRRTSRLLISAGVIFAFFDLPLWFTSPDIVSEVVYDRPGYVLNDEIAEFINSHTGESDTIYVAFSQAEIYYLAKRRNAVTQLYGYELTASQDAYEDIVSSIRRRDPALIVWVQLPPPELATEDEFEALLLTGYVEVQQFVEEDPLIGAQDVIRVYARQALESGKGLPLMPAQTGAQWVHYCDV
ncbi:MAG: hypothetical protein JXA10_05400 [Anaerolineae bacterium]|nr:hypothetical protein [Anaerolineae bacterium]